MISEKVQRIGTSPTLKISAKAKAMKAEGIDVVDLSVGEPDFPTPENIKDAGVKAIRENFTKYTENDGIPALRKAIAKRLKEDFGVEYAPNQIIVSSGAKSSLFHLIQALVNEDEEVIFPAPYWVTYPESVVLAKGKPVAIPTREEDGFLMKPDQLKAAISPATKAIILNNPCNPSGAVYNKDQLVALAEVIRGEDVYVVADEIYAALLYDNFKFTSFAALGEDIKKKTILINGVSKTYSMTGWRIGFAAGPLDVISGMSKIQSHTTSNACSISQRAALEAYGGPQHDVQKMAAEFQRRRNFCLMRLATAPGLSCFKPQGAFYLFPNVKSFYDKEFNGARIRNSYGMAYYLLREANVAIVPGDSFGMDDYIRLSYATSMANLEKGMDRIVAALARLKPAKKAKRVALSNAVTRVKKSVPVEAAIDVRMRDALASEMEGHLGYEGRFEWNANVNGAIIQLRTNNAHLNDFWTENWFPAELGADLEPHGIVYAVDGIAGREPRAFYNAETKTAILVNTDNYGPLRSLALGMAMDIAERAGTGAAGSGGGSAAGAVRGMSADVDGSGLILVGPPGTKKTELFFELLADRRFKMQANDIAFIRVGGGRATADCVERKLYQPVNTVEQNGALAPLFDRSKCENVVTRKEDCTDLECQRGEDCRLDRGSLYCYKAAKDAYAMLDPNWLGGPGAFARRTQLRWIFLLRNDATSPAVVELSKDETLRILETGEAAGARTALTPGKAQPFYNPHWLGGGTAGTAVSAAAAGAGASVAGAGGSVPTTIGSGSAEARLEAQRAFFSRLLDCVKVYLFNSGVAGVEKIKDLVAR